MENETTVTNTPAPANVPSVDNNADLARSQLKAMITNLPKEKQLKIADELELLIKEIRATAEVNPTTAASTDGANVGTASQAGNVAT